VLLLVKGVFGVTIVGQSAGEVSYMPTQEAISQRQVNAEEIALYERLGFFFGRDPQPYQARTKEVHGMVSRIYD
jgi:hypothetical protein